VVRLSRRIRENDSCPFLIIIIIIILFSGKLLNVTVIHDARLDVVQHHFPILFVHFVVVHGVAILFFLVHVLMGRVELVGEGREIFRVIYKN